VKGDFS